MGSLLARLLQQLLDVQSRAMVLNVERVFQLLH